MGNGIAYRVVRSKRKTMAITVEQDLSVVVRVPLRMPWKAIDRFVTENRGWIETHLVRQAARNAVAQTLTPEKEAALRRRAQEVLPGRVAYFSEQMGLVPAGVRITGAKTRLGSCGVKNTLNFSFRLMAYPPEAVDYVVVHELAHIRHKDHSLAFYALIAQYLPDYRDRLEILKDPTCRLL